ncbi:unnamed protein product [Chrysoparadoxa australica]
MAYAERRVHVEVSLLLNPARDAVAPCHEPVDAYFASGDKVLAVVDVREGAYMPRPSNPPRAPGSRIPVTILTGFLGAGKTTFLNHLLHIQRGKKIAVIENEFGEVAIDNELLASNLSTAEQVVVLDNGCMCCTVRGDLLGAFTSVLAAMDAENPLDGVIVETTGMADPVPIVRTFMQTPAISQSFHLDGVVTLADAKNVLTRLEGIQDVLATLKRGEVDEAFQQLMFADRLVLSKVDLVGVDIALRVWEAIRGINKTAKILPCVKGGVDAEHIMGFGAFNMSKLVTEDPDFAPDESQSNGHSHSHSHSHSHGHGHDHTEECEEECEEVVPPACSAVGCQGGDGGAHSHDHSRHGAAVGTFSITKPGHEVDALQFARWVRLLATLPEDKGVLYRCKAVLAVRGSNKKLAFHSVSDVTESGEVGEWKKGEERVCKIVLIGKNLERAWFEEGFIATLCPVRDRQAWVNGGRDRVSPTISTILVASPCPDFDPTLQLSILCAQSPHVVGCILLYNLSAEVVALGRTSRGMASALLGDAAEKIFSSKSSGAVTANPGMHPLSRKNLYLHHLASMPFVQTYCAGAKASQLDLPADGLKFSDKGELEAAGVTWLELASFADGEAQNFVVDFTWRTETIQEFLDTRDSSTSSSMVKVCYEGEWEEDTLKFRHLLHLQHSQFKVSQVQLQVLRSLEKYSFFHLLPSPSPGFSSLAYPPLNSLWQTIGGRSCSQVYQASFHSISPSYQVHVAVDDHRLPLFETDQIFHRWHPLITGLQTKPSLRFLVRIKPDGTGPLDNMCGCC